LNARLALARSVLCVGFPGARVDDVPFDALRAFGPGAVIVFSRNVGTPIEVRDLFAALRGLAPLPPLVAVDQEGGRVARLGADLVAEVPAAMAVAAAGDPAACERLGRLLGRDLAALGVSVNFAPVADLALHPDNAVIGNRSYGSDPHAVARFAIAFARGLEAAGVASALKHVPGHGDTAVDSHRALPRLAADASLLRARDLVPFAAAIAANAASIVMPAHALTPFDPDRPATISRRVLHDLVRMELGFAGVIATDDLEMDAIARGIGTVRGAVEALAAGADLLLICHRLDLAHEAAAAIVAAVERGELPAARLEEAAERVARLREAQAQPAPPLDVETGEPLAVARRAVTVLRGSPRLADGKPVTVISFEGAAHDGAAGPRAQTPSLSAALRARRWQSEVMRVALEPDADDLELLLAHLPSLGDRNFVIVTRAAHRYPAQAAAVNAILAVVPEALLISAREPYDIACFPAARTAICIYGDERISFEGCADVLSGRAQAAGVLPVGGFAFY
jgi:beta-N-acetylhexosaminidase